jgi:hypothetical protein
MSYEYTYDEYLKDQEFLHKMNKREKRYQKEKAYIERITEKNKLKADEQSREIQKENA